MAEEYIARREGGCFFSGSRVSLDSVVYEFLKGESPEGIVQSFPSLSLVRVYGGISFYNHKPTSRADESLVERNYSMERPPGSPGVEHRTPAFLEALAPGGGKPLEQLSPTARASS